MRRISYANVTATLALVVALGGTSYAAFALPANSVGTRELRAASVTPGKIEPRSLTAALFKRGALPDGKVGPAGAVGAAGPVGATGATGATGPAGPIAGTPAGGALTGTYPNPRLAASEHEHTVGAPGEPAYGPSMQGYGSTDYPDLAFYRDPVGTVHLSGLACHGNLGTTTCTDGTGGFGSVLVFTLPVGDRPTGHRVFMVQTFGFSTYYAGRLDITTDGAVTLVYPPTSGLAWISFDGVEFRAA